VLPDWFPWTTGAGSPCGLQVSAELRRDGDGALITNRIGEAEQEATLASAQDYLDSLNLDSIDREEATGHWFAYLERVSVDHPDRGELEAQFHGERLEIQATMYEVDTRLGTHLTAQGHRDERRQGCWART
jgi:hypothetical protein